MGLGAFFFGTLFFAVFGVFFFSRATDARAMFGETPHPNFPRRLRSFTRRLVCSAISSMPSSARASILNLGFSEVRPRIPVDRCHLRRDDLGQVATQAIVQANPAIGPGRTRQAA